MFLSTTLKGYRDNLVNQRVYHFSWTHEMSDKITWRNKRILMQQNFYLNLDYGNVKAEIIFTLAIIYSASLAWYMRWILLFYLKPSDELQIIYTKIYLNGIFLLYLKSFPAVTLAFLSRGIQLYLESSINSLNEIMAN